VRKPRICLRLTDNITTETTFNSKTLNRAAACSMAGLNIDGDASVAEGGDIGTASGGF
jgi:hypothetical protein